jgi:hypothetical protein
MDHKEGITIFSKLYVGLLDPQIGIWNWGLNPFVWKGIHFHWLEE